MRALLVCPRVINARKREEYPGRFYFVLNYRAEHIVALLRNHEVINICESPRSLSRIEVFPRIRPAKDAQSTIIA